MFSRFLFMFAVLLTLCVGTATNATAQSTSRVTVEVCCSSQQKVDQPHGVTLEVKKPDGSTVAFSVPIPAGTKAQDIAGKIADALRGNGVPVGTPTPNTHPRFAEGTGWDVKLPPGYVLKKAKVQKKVDGHWQDDDGHLKIRDHKKKISNPDQEAGGDSLAMQCCAPNDAQSFSMLDFTQDAWSGDSKGMEVYLKGVDADGAEFEYVKTVEYAAGDALPAHDFEAIGDILASLGMTVTYPSASQMHVDVSSSGLTLQEVEFTMYDATPHAVNDSLAAWGFDAY